jgi:putative restriction endonuclease
MPFVHLERDLWDLRDAAGQEIGPHAPERRAWLLDRGAVGRLRAPAEHLLADPKTLAAAARLLLDLHFTPVLAELICAAVDLDVPALDLAATVGATQAARLRQRRRGFAEEVLRTYAYQCAMCGFDGALGRYPVGIEAAHVRWHSQQGPDEITNALALCALHHVLFELGVLGITEDRRIRVSSLYVARNEAGMAVDTLAGKPLLIPRPHQPTVDIIHISWHRHQVFKGHLLRPLYYPGLG